jgi:hypothetical protein
MNALIMLVPVGPVTDCIAQAKGIGMIVLSLKTIFILQHESIVIFVIPVPVAPVGPVDESGGGIIDIYLINLFLTNVIKKVRYIKKSNGTQCVKYVHYK